jgi:adenylate cyclase class IV
MKYDYIQKVYFNKEITDRPLDDYDDRLGRFCIIEMKTMDNQEERKKRICRMLTCIMNLMGYPGEISNENFSGKVEINHCWVSEDDANIYIQHKYWDGHEMKLFCDIIEALGKYLNFEIEYLSAEMIRSIGTY